MRSKAAGQLTLILIYDLFNLFISQPQLTPPTLHDLFQKQYAGWCPCIPGLQWSSLTVDPQLHPPSDDEETRGEPCIFPSSFLLLHSQVFGIRMDAATLFFIYLLSFSPFLFFLASQDSLELSGRLYLWCRKSLLEISTQSHSVSAA